LKFDGDGDIILKHWYLDLQKVNREGFTMTQHPENKSTATDFNAVGLNILKLYPLPNQPGQGASSVNNYFSNAPIVSNQNTINVRVDHRFSEKHSMFARFDWFQRYN